ncbi:winged helix DNA-binding domain-containing protein [Chitinophaga arvensicola]|uniref:Winged helix DNA-binding domain-containing protein n=1 Tax=Chitinophaga arvensicola TaxID=29529 RepID=A0A1I0QST6_9BACT|nr:winged helix DNA-binding domain-containing protein [Chitinophaga arvensicola]SEW30481.1 Winged helix DNA-binding domain-containing protein [Chitinophaga arvensicola]
MTVTDIAALRLQHQQLIKTSIRKPEDIVSFFGAMQAQEYGNSKWGIGVRLPGSKDSDIEKALASKAIIRTTAFRGTLHLIAAADVRWVIQIIAPAVKTRMGSLLRKLEMNDAFLQNTNQLITKALAGGNYQTRKDLTTLLQSKGVNTDDHRMDHIIYHAAVDGLICNGPWQGKQPTFALLDEWLPGKVAFTRDQSLVILAQRFFISHGPATVPDFAQWAGITLTDAKAGLEGTKATLKSLVLNDVTYWMGPQKKQPTPDTALLLPAFDEYFIGYKDRSTLIDMAFSKKVITPNGIFSPILVRNGQVIGTWKRTIKKDSVTIAVDLFKPLKKADLKAFEPAALQYAEFMELSFNGFS